MSLLGTPGVRPHGTQSVLGRKGHSFGREPETSGDHWEVLRGRESKGSTRPETGEEIGVGDHVKSLWWSDQSQGVSGSFCTSKYGDTEASTTKKADLTEGDEEDGTDGPFK